MGKKSLFIKILGNITLNAYVNENRVGNQPHYKGEGVVVWIVDDKREEKKQKETDEYGQIWEGVKNG